MVDDVRVLRLLRAISDDVAVLRAESEPSDERRSDLMWIRGIKYTFVTAIEACVDVAQQLRHQVRRAPAVLEGRAVTGAGPPDHRGRPSP